MLIKYNLSRLDVDLVD